MLEVNGERYALPAELRDASLLDVIRDHLALKGTKYGCGAGLCGACTVHVDGEAIRSCTTRAADVEGKRITTIEGLSHAGAAGLHPVQQAWIAESVPQCGYCQSGQIMAAAAFLASHPDPSDEEIKQVMSANLCRCGTYLRIRRAVRRAAALIRSGAPP
jgi:isoquinoline 1-oxidoreductase alpha subunit